MIADDQMIAKMSLKSIVSEKDDFVSNALIKFKPM
jgi:hypothetical protein